MNKKLVEIGNDFLKGEFESSYNKALFLENENDDKFEIVQCNVFKALCSIYFGSATKYMDALNKIEAFAKEEGITISEKKMYELASFTAKAPMLLSWQCPKWIDEGDFHDLPKEAYALARLLFIFQRFCNKEELHYIYALAPLGCQTDLEQNEPAMLYTDLLLGCCFHENGNHKRFYEYLDKALDIALSKGWYAPLIERRTSMGITLDRKLLERNPEAARHVKKMNKEYMAGWEKVSASIRGEKNLVGRLNIREFEIAKFAALGKRNKEIAELLCLSPETVRYNMSIIIQKLEISSRKEINDMLFFSKFGR